MADQELELAIPQVGPYLVTEELFRTAHGITYSATDSEAERPILLQVIDPTIANGENFIVRFELLKTLLPAIQHTNILSVIDLGVADNVYYLAKEMPSLPLTTLATYDFRDAPNTVIALDQVFSGLANGLSALEETTNVFHRQGIIHSTLAPEQVYLCTEKALVGSDRLIPKVDGCCDAFLFYGDGVAAQHHYHVASAARTPNSLHSNEPYCPPSSRSGAPPAKWWHQYAFGALAYEAITHRKAKGTSIPIDEYNTHLDPLWNTIITRCLQADQGKGYESMHQVVDAFETVKSKSAAQPSTTRRIRERQIPEGMALILLDEKVELGSHAGPANERPAFRAKVKPFYLDKTPVTNEAFERFLRDHHRSSYSRADQMPATLVSWHMAKAYCRWRSEQEKLPPDTYRLPTEYEWEAAVRGITGYQYPWGEQNDDRRCHSNKSKECGAVEVTTCPSARFGVYDLLGNVWEWTESEYQPHPFSKDTDPRYNKGLRVVKGGCWFTPLTECRAALRHAYGPSEARANIGFRCARTIEDEH